MSEPGKPALILIIDDEESIRDGCFQTLTKSGFEVITSPEGTDGIRRARERKPDMVFLDLKMPGMTGMEVLDVLSKDIPDIVLVVITGYATIVSAVEAMKKGAYDYLPKPFIPDQLRVLAQRGLEHRSLKIEARRLREEKELFEKSFITFVSHEMRSPLVTVLQYMETMKVLYADKFDHQFNEILNKCTLRVRSLEELVNHWLDIDRVAGESFSMSKEPVNLPDLIENAIEDLSPISEKRGITVTLEPPPDNIPEVLGDSESLLRVMNNLIGNATKYTDSGGRITSKISFDEYYVTVEITDTGKGIPADKLQFVFEPFYRVLGKREPYKGSGLGLTFCKKIMDAHNGQIEVSSKEGVGTTFLLKFPR
jgi:two-component system, sensor histidine kinase and response regulator